MGTSTEPPVCMSNPVSIAHQMPDNAVLVQVEAAEVGRHNRKIVDKIEKLGSIATLPLSALDTSPTHPRIPALDAKMHPATAPQPESRSFATAAPHSRLSPPQN